MDINLLNANLDWSDPEEGVQIYSEEIRKKAPFPRRCSQGFLFRLRKEGLNGASKLIMAVGFSLVIGSGIWPDKGPSRITYDFEPES